MATQTLEFNAGTGLSLTCKVFEIGSDTVIATASAVEKTNDKNRYTVAFTNLPEATYRLNAFVGSVPGFANESYNVRLATDTYYPISEGVEPTTGTGPYAFTVNLTYLTLPLADVRVSMVLNGNVVAFGRTDIAGQVVFGLIAGTYQVVVASSTLYLQPTIDPVSVPADADVDVALLPVNDPDPAIPGLCTVRFSVILNGNAVPGATVTAEVETLNSMVDQSLVAHTQSIGVTNSSGYADLVLIRFVEFTSGGTYRVTVRDADGVRLYSKFVHVPDLSFCWADDLIEVGAGCC